MYSDWTKQNISVRRGRQTHWRRCSKQSKQK